MKYKTYFALALAQIWSLLFYLGLIAALALPALLDMEQIRVRLEQSLCTKPKCSLSIGSLQLSYSPWPVLQLQDISLSRPDALHLDLQQASLHFDPFSALQGRIQVNQAKLQGADLTLPWPKALPDKKVFSKSELQHFLNLLPQGLEIFLQQSSLVLEHAKHSRFALQDIQLKASLQQKLALELSAANQYCQDLELELEFDPAELASTGHLNLQGLFLDKGYLQTAGINISILESVQLKRLFLDFNLQGLQDLQGQIRAGPAQIMLSGPGPSQELQNVELKGAWSWQDQLAGLELHNLNLPAAGLKIQGLVHWDQNQQNLDFDLQGSLQKVAPIRELGLELWPENRVLGHVLRILRQGEIPRARVRAQGQSPEQIFSSLVLQSRLEKGQIRVREADLTLHQVSALADIQDKHLKVHNLQAELLGSQVQDGRLDLGLNREIRPFSLQASLQSDLTQLPEILNRYIQKPRLQQELHKLDNVQGQGSCSLSLDKAHKEAPMQVQVQARDFSLQADYARLPLQLNIRGGEFTYQKHSIQLKDLELELGSSAGLLQGLSLNWAAEPKWQFQAARTNLNLQELLPWLERQAWFPGLLPGWEIEQGGLDLQELRLKGPLQQPRLWEYQAQGTIRDAIMRTQQAPWDISLPSAGFKLEPGAIELEQCRLLAGDSSLLFSGILQGIPGRPQAGSLRMSGILGSQGLDFVSSRLELPQRIRLKGPLLLQETNLEFAPGARTNVQTSLIGPQGTELEIGLDHGPGQKLAIKASLLDEHSRAEMDYRAEQEFLHLSFQGDLQAASLDNLLLQNQILQDSLQGALNLSYKPSKYLLTAAEGSLQAAGLSLPLPGIKPRLRIAQLGLQAKDKALHLQQARIEFLEDCLELKGRLVLGQQNVLDLEFSADRIHWPTWNQALGPFIAGHKERKASLEFLETWQGSLGIQLKELAFTDYSLQPLWAALEFQQQDLKLDIQKAGLCGIILQGALRPDPEGYRLDLDLACQDLDLSQSLACLDLDQTLLDGDYSLQGKLQSQAMAIDQLLDSLQGELEFKARQGRIYRMQLLSRILTVLNATEVFFGIEPDLEQEGFAYNKILIQAELNNNQLYIAKGLLDGETLEMAFTGEIDLHDKELELLVLVAPLKTVDRLIKRLPLFSTILGGNLVSIPVRVHGDLYQPRISPMSPRAVSQTLVNILKRSLQAPVDILQPMLPEEETD